MSNVAWGNSICLSTPHYRATVSGIEEYFVAGHAASHLQCCVLKAALALQFNLPQQRVQMVPRSVAVSHDGPGGRVGIEAGQCRRGTPTPGILFHRSVLVSKGGVNMYTGIVQGMAAVIASTDKPACRVLVISNQHGLFDDVAIGASVSLDGVCLTVTACDSKSATFEASPLTLSLTTLRYLVVGSIVNVERSHKSGQENGGHGLYGHVEGVARVVGWHSSEQGTQLQMQIPDGKIRYFFHNGFLGLHGCSLTVNRVDLPASTLVLNLIPETLRQTNLSAVKMGDELNFEVDQHTRVLVDTLARCLAVAAPE